METERCVLPCYENVTNKLNEQINSINMNVSQSKNKDYSTEEKKLVLFKHNNLMNHESYSCDKDSDNLYIQTQCFENDSLKDLLENRRKMKEDLQIEILISYMGDLIRGLKYFHQNNVIYKNLKPDFIFISDKGLVIGGLDENVITNDDDLNYIAPEILLNNSNDYTKESDIYSLGCIFYELYTLRVANSGCNTKESRLLKKIEFCRYKSPRINKIESLISKMLNNLPNSRITLDRIEILFNSIKKSYSITKSSEFSIPTVGLINNNYTIQRVNTNSIEEKEVNEKMKKEKYVVKDVVKKEKYVAIDEDKKDDREDMERIYFYLGKCFFEGLSIRQCNESNMNNIDFYKHKEFFFPHKKQEKYKLTEYTVNIFKTNMTIKKCYFSMINLVIKKYGYKYDGLSLARKDARYDKFKGKEETISLFKHIENSIIDIYKENNEGYLIQVKTIIADQKSEDDIDSSYYESLIVGFYIEGSYVMGKTLREISELSQSEFELFWSEDLVTILYPFVDQSNAPFCNKDLEILKKYKDEYIEDLHKVTTLLVQKFKKDNKNGKLVIITDIMPFFRLIDDDEGIELLENSIKDMKMVGVIGFLLDNSESIDGITLDKLAKLEQKDFNNLSVKKYTPYIFPYIGQYNPSFTNKDLQRLRKYKGNYSLYESTKAIVEKLLRKYKVNIDTDNNEIMINIMDVDMKELDHLSDILQKGYEFHSNIENDVELIVYLKNLITQLDKIIYTTKCYDNSNDKLYEKIGKGGFGTVYKVEHNGMIMARKDIEINNVNLEIVINEINIMKEMRNANVLICFDEIYDKSNSIFHIYTQYFKCDLSRKIRERKRKNKGFSTYNIVCFMRDIINGIKCIHNRGIIHRDLKPSNIFVDESAKLVIGDFGLAVDTYTKDSKLLGSLSYIAPELWDRKPPPYSTASDIFALGCILYELYTLNVAFKGENMEEVKRKIIFSTPLDFNRQDSTRNYKIEGLITNMLKKDVKERVNLEYIEKILNTITPVVDFYLENGSCNGYRLDDVYCYNSIGKLFREDLLVILFPEIGQEDPSFSRNDANDLLKNKSFFIEKYGIIVGNMCRLVIEKGGLEKVIMSIDSLKEQLQNIISRMESFSRMLGDDEVEKLVECMLDKDFDNKKKYLI